MMNERDYKSLELDKIVEMAAARAVCPETLPRLREERPQTQPEAARMLLRQTDALAACLVKNGNPRLSSCPGADMAVSRAQKGGVLSMAELLLVAGALRNFAMLEGWFKAGEEKSTPADDLFFTLSPQPALAESIRAAILSEGEMADTASDELYSLRRKIRQAEASIRDKLDAVVKNPGVNKYLQDPIVSLRNGRFVVPVKAEHRGEVGGVIHDVSSSGGTLFVEPSAVVEANAKVLQLKNQEQAEIDRILGEFSENVAEIAPFFAASYEAMLEIDKRLAKAELGLSMNGVCPEISGEAAFSLVKARHPLLSRDSVVPVDIELGIKYDTMVITGPNTGGKTVSLKTAGLLSAMGQMGYLIPADDRSVLGCFERFLVDIGDEQSIEQSLSTFSGHIRNITGILAEAGRGSLVLLDELGAGTDPAEGAALAVSIIERLRESGAATMATTHYAELKLYALETEGVQNAGCEFDVETLRPTYKLVVGVPGRSNAFFIGEKLGIPAAVIENARRHLSTEQRRFETVLGQLEEMKKELADKETEIEELRYAADHQLELARQKRDELIRQGEAELEAAREKAKALADEVENKAFGLIDEMKRLEKNQRVANAQKAQRAREIAKNEASGLSKLAKQGQARRPRQYRPLESVKLGQEVWLPEMDKLATVTALPDRSGQVEVRMGALRTKLPLGELAASAAAAPPLQKSGQTHVTRQAGDNQRGPQTELNLLGKTVDEALLECDQFIDNAVLRGLTPVYIIHGRGTGALRTAITRHLKGHKNVASFRLGRYGEGEDGVTVAELK